MSQDFLIRLNDSWHFEKRPQCPLLGGTKIYVARQYPKSQVTENSLAPQHFPCNSSVLCKWMSECERNGVWGMRGRKDTQWIKHSRKERDTTALRIWWSSRCNSLFKSWTGFSCFRHYLIEHKKWRKIEKIQTFFSKNMHHNQPLLPWNILSGNSAWKHITQA